MNQPWHARAWTYRDMLGEINYASKFYGRALKNVEFYASEKDQDGEWVRSENTRIIAAVERLQIHSWVEQFGVIMFLTGEGLLFATENQDTTQEQWEFVSKDELRVIEGGRYERVGAPGMVPEELRDAGDDVPGTSLGDGTIVYRMWQPHPQYSQLSDSPMRSILDLCEEMVLLTLAIRSTSLNRSANTGLLLWPEQMSFKETDTVGDEDPDADPFFKRLTETMTAPISDPGTASAIVPPVIRLDKELIPEANGGPRLLRLDHAGQQPYGEAEVRSDTIKRIAIGLDMPPEILLGFAESNHWTAWQIDEQVWEAHILPVTMTLCENLTQHYLWPTLRGEVSDPSSFRVWYDEAAVVKRPDRSSDAKDLHDRGALNDRALREANAFDEDDAPSPEEPNTNPHVITALGQSVAGGGPIEETGQPQEAAPPPAPPEGAAMTSSLLPAAAVALERCREVAGNRIKTAARKKAMDYPVLSGNARCGDYAWMLQERETTKATGQLSIDLVQGGAKVLLPALAGFGYTAEEALCVQHQVEQYAAATLYEERPAPIPPELLDAPCFA